MGAPDSNQEKSGFTDDCKMLPPISYLTEGVNRGLAAIFDNFKFSFLVFMVIYVVGLTYVIQLDIDIIYKIFAFLTPILFPIAFFFIYIVVGSVLLAFFAYEPEMRIGNAVGLQVLILFPAFLIVLADTILFSVINELGYLIIALIFLNMIGFPYLIIRYQEKVVRYSHWCAPITALFIFFIWFEGTLGFSYTRIEKEHFSIGHCEIKIPRDKFGNRTGSSYTVCDVELNYDGNQYKLKNMVVPDEEVEYMELRQAIFKHLRLR